MVSTSFHDPEFWRTLAPELTIDALRQTGVPISFEAHRLELLSQSMLTEGYLESQPAFDASELLVLRSALETLDANGLPPVFIYLYDQPWSLFRRLHQLISHFLGENFKLLPNFWAWNIPVIEKASGWPIHRDCDASTRFESLDLGQTLMSLSIWLPLTDATRENGCMHVLPRSKQGPYPDIIASIDEIERSDVRSLPVSAGSVLAWSQDLYHWSGQVTENAAGPRMSLSLEFQSAHFAPLAEPLFDIAAPPTFNERLDLILHQFNKYKHMEAVFLPGSLRQSAERLR